MSNILLNNRLNRLKDDVMRFKNSICAYETTDATRYPENFASLGMDMVIKAEMIACSTRNIVSAYPRNQNKVMMTAAADAQGIEVRNINHGYEIIIPSLMPKRNLRNNSEFILDPLCYVLNEFGNKNPIERMDKALIWYLYEYTEDTPARHINDYDNLESKEVLDVVNAFFLVDDRCEFCELRFSSKRGQKNCTHILISPELDLISYPE